MDQQTILHLLKVYQQQTATPEERTEFAKLLHDKRYESLFNQVLEQYWEELEQDEIDQVQVPAFNKILKEIKEEQQIVKPSRKLWPIIAAAASILLVASLGLYFYINGETLNGQPEIVYQNDVAPGKNGATLTLANGKKIQVADALAGHIANEAGVKISKTADGQIVYSISSAGLDAEGQVGFNTLSTTRGEQSQVRLPDGTLVFFKCRNLFKISNKFCKSS